MDLLVIIPLFISIATFYLGRQRGAKEEGEKRGILLSELQYIKADVQELKSEFKEINAHKINAEMNVLKIQFANLKEELAETNKRIDAHLYKEHKIG